MHLRTFQRLLPCKSYRCLSTSTSLQSGHSRWSKIKHDKGANDMKRNVLFSVLAKDIAQASRLYGGDPNMNPRLASALAAAKKVGFPKDRMQSAILRGQGKSLSGGALENVTLEVIYPPSIGLVIEAETDSKLRTLADLRMLLKHYGATPTPTSYLFTKKGRVQFEKDDRALGVDEVLEEAIEAGAEDVETDEEGNIVVWTEPSQTNQAAQTLSAKLNLKIQSTDIIWDANEDTKSSLNGKKPDEATSFAELLGKIRDNPNVQAVYSNVAKGELSDAEWDEIEDQLD